MHCKDCRHWKPYLEFFERAKPNNSAEQSGGICTNQLIDEDCENKYNYLENSLTYPYNEGGFFWTGAKFGCVNFEEN